MAAARLGGASGLSALALPAKIGLGALTVVLVGALYFVVFYGEVDAAITREMNQHATLQSELSRAKESEKAYQADLEEKARREKLAGEQKKVLPDDAEVPAFLASIQGVATVSGVTLASYTPKDEVVEQFYAKVPMELTMTGRFHQVARFFYGVGQLDRIINVEDIELVVGKTKAEGDEIVLTVKCLATAFRAVQSGESASGDAGRRRRK